MDWGREIRLNKCLAEAEDSAAAFGVAGSMHTNTSDGTCHSNKSLTLLCR